MVSGDRTHLKMAAPPKTVRARLLQPVRAQQPGVSIRTMPVRLQRLALSRNRVQTSHHSLPVNSRELSQDTYKTKILRILLTNGLTSRDLPLKICQHVTSCRCLSMRARGLPPPTPTSSSVVGEGGDFFLNGRRGQGFCSLHFGEEWPFFDMRLFFF